MRGMATPTTVTSSDERNVATRSAIVAGSLRVFLMDNKLREDLGELLTNAVLDLSLDGGEREGEIEEHGDLLRRAGDLSGDPGPLHGRLGRRGPVRLDAVFGGEPVGQFFETPPYLF